MRRTLWTLLLAAAFAATACGGGPNPVDKDSIRRNADDADRDLDRESDRNQD
ncbi:MAG: hypothetical protein KC613_00915 [Myxococcales bacterium]|nr:hypothetical protein [Myxococcales bacterium]MCB9523389.1 hypothetical protein [Myxococcales bacterium]